MRILHVIPSVAPCRGGPSKAIIEMVCALNTIGVRCEIATTNDACTNKLDVNLSELTQYKGAPIRFFDRYSSSISAISEFQYSRSFVRWIKEHISDYDLIHVHAIFSFCSTYTMWLARQKEVPYVVRPIGQLEQWSLGQSATKKKLYLDLIEKQNLLNSSAVHFTALSESEQALSLLPNLKSILIPLGIDLPKIIPDASLALRKKWQLDSDIPIIVYLSRIHPKKGLELLFESLASLNGEPFKLIIAGDGDSDYIAQLKLKTQQLGLSKQIIWAGFTTGKDKDLLLQGADLFVLTSYSENFGIAVLEALASGTPALVTDGVALSHEIKLNNLGYVTTTSINSITKNLSHAINEIKGESNSTSQRCRKYVSDHYQWSMIATQLQRLYKSII